MKKSHKKDKSSSDSSSSDDFKNIKKEEKKAAYELKKKAREEARELKRQQRALEKSEKKSDKVETPVNIPSGSTVYIDGNNLLFVLGPIRSCSLHNGKATGETMLQKIAEAWTKTINGKVYLVFDDTRKNSSQENFAVSSARPFFPSTDDAFIYWSKQLPSDQAKQTVFFTSDRKLTEEIAKSGAQVFKSKAFFITASFALGRKPEESLDNWANRFLNA